VLKNGVIVAGYRIEGVLGEGSMGVVYRATELSRHREVALKVLGGRLGDEPEIRARFEREGRVQASLHHDHIVTTYATGDSEHGLFLAMRLIEGPTLKALIQAGELDPGRTLSILSQVAQALDEAHAAGLIHRDVKPQNILVGADDHAYLCDFGLSRAPNEVRLTGTGQFLGTIDYVAPEQIQSEPATAAGDVYSLAGVLCECLTGEVPFPKPTDAGTLYAQVMEPPPKLTDRRPELAPGLDEVIARGMAKEPGDRPGSATELIDEARRAIG
jgi:serine/threonine protein kinase